MKAFNALLHVGNVSLHRIGIRSVTVDQPNENIKPMEERHIRQILLSRYYLELAEQQGRIGQEPARFAAINMLHEAFETALVCFVDALGADVPNTAAIDKLVAGIEKIIGSPIPFRVQIFRFNKIRVNAKHHIVAPDGGDLKSYLAIIPEFIAELTRIVFGRAIHEVSLSDLILDDVVRSHIEVAVSAFSVGKDFDCLVACRRAIYVLFEKQYDITPFLADDGTPGTIFDPKALCRAPFYAKSKKYIEEQVKEPFDFIVIDQAHLEGELIKDGIDTHSFWNLCRLTPRVYQRSDGRWANGYSSSYIGLDRAECAYVIDTLIRMILQRQAKRGTLRMAKLSWQMIKVKPGSPFFNKASFNAPIVGYIPSSVAEVSISGATPSLEDDNWFYSFWHFDGDQSLSGYISVANVIGESFERPLNI